MCESCKNLGSIYCDECCRNINLADFYEATDSNDEAQKESLKKKAISEWMSLETSAKFQETFNKAAAFTLSEEDPGYSFRYALAGVHVSQSSLSASDGAIFADIYHFNPTELVGKTIVEINEDKVAVCNDPFPDTRLAFRNTGKNLIKLPEPIIEEDIVHFDLETPVAIKKSYYDKIINCLSGDIFLYYNPEKLAPLLFSGSNGRIVVAPLRKKY